jgi:phospholipid/cholesterol/gamma-HCH transport system permease protein
VPLVAMVSFFLGLTMALLTGYQWSASGRNARAGPGRDRVHPRARTAPHWHHAGGAASAPPSPPELGTMQVSEEVEAIEAMGIGPLRFLVAPRLLALFALMPCLSVISSMAAIFAIALISRAYFNIAFVYFPGSCAAGLARSAISSPAS